MKLWICLSVLLLGCSTGASPEEPRKAVVVAPVAVRQAVPRPAAFASFPTSPVNASSIKGLPVPTPTPTGAVLTVAAGPSLIWNVPAAGIMLSSTVPEPVSATAGAIGVGATAARSDHVHVLPIVPLAKGGTNSATGDLVATNFLGTPWLKLSSIASPGTPASGATWLYSTTANGQDQLYLNTSDGVATALGSGNVIVRNTSGAPITKGQAVYVTGATGNVPNVTLARSNAVASAVAYCIVLTSIADNAYGRCMRTGVITGVDTSAFTSGDVLWVSSSVAGALQNTDPVWPNYSSHVGYVLTSGVGNGSIAVDASPDYTGNETGTTSASWTVGPGSGASAASVQFANANTGTLSWTPTGTRTLTLPDTTSSLVASNDTRLPPSPTAANKLVYDTGTDYAETAACGTAGYILEGGSPPACTQSPTVGTKITVPRIDSSGALILNGATGNNVQLSVNSTTVLTAAATGLTATQPLAMSSKNITGLAPATANGDALSYPWITSGATFNTLASGFNITASNGTYAGTGLTYTFPEAGTYWCEATVRSSVGVSVGAGANISLKLRNTTTSTDITNSIRIGAYASTIGVAYITTTPFAEVVTVSGADTLEVYAASNTGTTYTTRSVDSDSAGYSKLGCMKIAP